MPLAHWIKNNNGHPVCVWGCDLEMSALNGQFVSAQSQTDKVVAVRKTAYGQSGNFTPADAKDALFCAGKLAA